MVPKDSNKEEQTHKKNALTEERAKTVENIEGHSGIRRKRYEAQVSLGKIEKTGEGNRLGRHDTDVGRTEGDRRNSKLPLRVKQLPSDLPLQKDSEKCFKKSQV